MNVYVLKLKYDNLYEDIPYITEGVYATPELAMAYVQKRNNKRPVQWTKHDSHGTYWAAHGTGMHMAARWVIEEFELYKD